MNTEPLTQFIEWTAALILETEEAMEREPWTTDEHLRMRYRHHWANEARGAAQLVARALGVET